MSKARPADEIRSEMSRLRTIVGSEMNDLADDAREMSDWRYYVRRYPWISLGAAVALGYLLVPQRLELVQPNPSDPMKLAEKNRVAIKPQPEPSPRGPGKALLRFAANAAMRSAMAYGGQKLGEVLNRSQNGTHRNGG